MKHNKLLIRDLSFEPDRTNKINTNYTDKMYNVFYDKDSNIIPIPDIRKAAPQPDETLSECLFATPATSGDFSLFTGTKKGLYVWSNLNHDWIKVYSSVSGSNNPDARWIIKDFNTVILAAKRGEGLLYFNREKVIFESVRNHHSFKDDVPAVQVEDIGAFHATQDCIIVWDITDKPNIIAWSGIKDCFNWSTQWTAGFTSITQGGNITCITGLNNCYIFTLRMIYRMYRTNTNQNLWTFKMISPSLGVYGYKDVAINKEGLVFFHDTQSAFTIDDNETIKDIGRYRIAKTYPYNHSWKILADVLARRFYIVMPGNGSLIYDEYADKWSAMEHEGLDVFIGNFTASSLDELDEPNSICLIPYSLDNVQDIYSCSLALSKEDGIYLLDNNKYLQCEISSGYMSDSQNNIKINNIKALSESNNWTHTVDYGFRYNTETKQISKQNNQGYANFHIRAGTYKITSRGYFIDNMEGWDINTKAGLFK